MKKCFLLISIILVAFGFSLNSSVISNSHNNNNNNNNRYLSREEESYDAEIEYTSIETYPNSSNENGSVTIDYKITNAPKEIEKIKWSGFINNDYDPETAFENEIDLGENESFESPPNKWNYDGNMTQENIIPGKKYNNTLFIGDEDGLHSLEPFYFTIPIINYTGYVKNEELEINNDNQTASLDYEITPATKKNDKGLSEEIRPSTIEWVDYNSDNILASTTNDYDNNNIWEDGYSGSLTTKSLKAGEYNTKLVVTDEENYTYESSSPIIFTIEDQGGETLSGEVKQAVDSEITTTYDTATIDYEITPATTNGIPNTPTKIMWVDEKGDELGGDGHANISNGKGIPLNKEDKDYEPLTATNLEQGGYENTYLEVTDNKGSIYTCNETFEIKTEPTRKTNGEIISLGTTNEIKEYGMYEATVNYKIIPANDDDGNANKVTKIQWIDKENDDDVILATKTRETDGIPLDGEDAFLTTHKLEAGKKYENTYLEVTDNNGGFYESTRVQTFWAANGDEDGKITANNSKITIVDEESATIDYTIDPAKDIFAEDNTPTKIMWVDSDGNELGGEGNANISNEKGIPLSDGDEGYEPLTATNLKPGTPYEDTHLEVTDSNNGKYNENSSIEKFVTVSAYDKGTIWKEGEIKTTGNSATITYGMTRTYNDQGNQFLPEKVKWYAIIDGDETLIASETPDSADGGEMTTDIFLPTNITYEKTYLVMEDNYQSNEDNGGDLHDNPKSETFELNTGNFKTRDMIIGGSAIAIVLFIIAVILFFFWAYKKRRRVN